VTERSAKSSPTPNRSRWAACLVLGLLVATIPGFIGLCLWTSGSWPERTAGSSVRSPEVYAGSPYQNARPDVEYVGDEACAKCHSEITHAYHNHSMGRSMAQVGGERNSPPTTGPVGLPFETQGVKYTIERRDDRVFHKATRRDDAGQVLAETEAEVRYALGSGRRGITYLIERDGFLYQSPIAWFGEQAYWGISPGYGEPNPRPHFERAIQTECLFCHTNEVRPVAGTLNRYEPPIFKHHAIGCERCHGPGDLHVKTGGQSAEIDMTIVNPAKLAPTLRESVCQQCHLQGWFRFPRAGRDWYDFRPGLPLHKFLAVFVRDDGTQGDLEFIGHVEQMESSRCFRASKGQLGCISCHDPHRLPEPSTKIAYYQKRCLECHDRKGCALPPTERRARGQGDDCIACHMPRTAVTNIAHMAATDHRILRDKSARVADGPQHSSAFSPLVPVRDYHWELMSEDEKQAASRDLGVALQSVPQILQAPDRLARVNATRALPLLEAAVRNRPDDLPARDTLGYTLELLDRRAQALRTYESILAIEPNREATLPSLARVLARLQRPDQSRQAMQKMIALNPWSSDYQLGLARACIQAEDWQGADAACRAAIRLNPELFEARALLIQSCLRAHEPDKAGAELEILCRFYPSKCEVWRRWYEQEKQTMTANERSSRTRKH
jgi:cytochrome c-type biogenesis protein CcmH/NrfG